MYKYDFDKIRMSIRKEVCISYIGLLQCFYVQRSLIHCTESNVALCNSFIYSLSNLFNMIQSLLRVYHLPGLAPFDCQFSLLCQGR